MVELFDRLFDVPIIFDRFGQGLDIGRDLFTMTHHGVIKFVKRFQFFFIDFYRVKKTGETLWSILDFADQAHQPVIDPAEGFREIDRFDDIP